MGFQRRGADRARRSELDQIGLAKEGTSSTAASSGKRKPIRFTMTITRARRDDSARRWKRVIPNLHLVGRNGMHKYNNQDHAMMTAMLCVENILADKSSTMSGRSTGRRISRRRRSGRRGDKRDRPSFGADTSHGDAGAGVRTNVGGGRQDFARVFSSPRVIITSLSSSSVIVFDVSPKLRSCPLSRFFCQMLG